MKQLPEVCLSKLCWIILCATRRWMFAECFAFLTWHFSVHPMQTSVDIGGTATSQQSSFLTSKTCKMSSWSLHKQDFEAVFALMYNFIGYLYPRSNNFIGWRVRWSVEVFSQNKRCNCDAQNSQFSLELGLSGSVECTCRRRTIFLRENLLKILSLLKHLLWSTSEVSTGCILDQKMGGVGTFPGLRIILDQMQTLKLKQNFDISRVQMRMCVGNRPRCRLSTVIWCMWLING